MRFYKRKVLFSSQRRPSLSELGISLESVHRLKAIGRRDFPLKDETYPLPSKRSCARGPVIYLKRDRSA